MSQKKFNVKLFNKIKSFNKTIVVDSDKSISIRSFLIGSISNGISHAKNVLESEDVISSIKCLKKLGVKIVKLKNSSYKIFGNGLGSYKAKKNLQLNFGNSGTLARLLIGILATTPNIEVSMTGDKSLKKRSMKKLITLMSRFGANFYPKKKFNFPFKIISSPFPIGIKYESGVSAQLKSAVIFSGLNSYGDTTIIEKKESRNHTENMLLKNTQIFSIRKNKHKVLKLKGKKYLRPITVDVPNDPSSAAFFTALTILNENSSLIIKNVGLNTSRIGFYHLLKNFGANIKFKNLKKKNNEPSGDIIIKSSKLKPIHASEKYYVNSTDEYPILFVIAALLNGTSTFKGISDLANKESNRIIEMQKILMQLGIKSRFEKDVLKIFGKGKINYSKKNIDTPNLGDHRICMSSFILGLLTGAKTNIKNFETVYTSSPSFLKIIKLLGAKFEIQK